MCVFQVGKRKWQYIPFLFNKSYCANGKKETLYFFIHIISFNLQHMMSDDVRYEKVK